LQSFTNRTDPEIFKDTRQAAELAIWRATTEMYFSLYFAMTGMQPCT